MEKTLNGRGPIGALSRTPVEVLVCFAAKEEARFFLPGPRPLSLAGMTDGPRSKALDGMPSCQAWLTGMGRRNAVESLRKALALTQPKRVITSGFAGGLNPALKFGTVVYDEDAGAGFGPRLAELGAVPATFHCHRRVATTVEEKSALWASTGLDVVEMESSVIRNLCREQKVPSATIRVISDDASQELPLDFNALMTPEDRIDYPKLFLSLLAHPGRIGKLIGFQRQTVAAARRLGGVLEELLRAKRS